MPAQHTRTNHPENFLCVRHLVNVTVACCTIGSLSNNQVSTREVLKSVAAAVNVTTGPRLAGEVTALRSGRGLNCSFASVPQLLL